MTDTATDTTRRLALTLTTAEGALVRTLGTIERRGWRMSNLRCTPIDADSQALELDVTPRDPSRNADVLKRQVERLIDVTSLEIQNTKTATTEPTP